MWIEDEPFWLIRPCLADELVGRETLEGLQSPCEVVGANELTEVLLQLGVVVVVGASDGGLLDNPVHSPDLTNRPRMVDVGEAMFDAMGTAAHGEHVGHVSRCGS